MTSTMPKVAMAPNVPVFDRVFYEGNPRNDWHGMQTVLLGASNGAVVEFIAPEEGDYLLVDHEFADAQKRGPRPHPREVAHRRDHLRDPRRCGTDGCDE